MNKRQRIAQQQPLLSLERASGHEQTQEQRPDSGQNEISNDFVPGRLPPAHSFSQIALHSTHLHPASGPLIQRQTLPATVPAASSPGTQPDPLLDNPADQESTFQTLRTALPGGSAQVYEELARLLAKLPASQLADHVNQLARQDAWSLHALLQASNDVNEATDADRVRVPLLQTSFEQALRAQDTRELASLLIGYNAIDRLTHLAQIPEHLLEPLKKEIERQAGDPAGELRVPILDRQINIARRQARLDLRHWQEAAELFNAFNESDQQQRFLALLDTQPAEAEGLIQGAQARNYLELVERLRLLQMHHTPQASNLDPFQQAIQELNATTLAHLLLSSSEPTTLATRLEQVPENLWEPIKQAVEKEGGEAASQVRTRILRQQLLRAEQRQNWPEAAKWLNAFNDEDIRAHFLSLLEENRERAEALVHGALNTQRAELAHKLLLLDPTRTSKPYEIDPQPWHEGGVRHYQYLPAAIDLPDDVEIDDSWMDHHVPLIIGEYRLIPALRGLPNSNPRVVYYIGQHISRHRNEYAIEPDHLQHFRNFDDLGEFDNSNLSHDAERFFQMYGEHPRNYDMDNMKAEQEDKQGNSKMANYYGWRANWEQINSSEWQDQTAQELAVLALSMLGGGGFKAGSVERPPIEPAPGPIVRPPVPGSQVELAPPAPIDETTSSTLSENTIVSKSAVRMIPEPGYTIPDTTLGEEDLPSLSSSSHAFGDHPDPFSSSPAPQSPSRLLPGTGELPSVEEALAREETTLNLHSLEPEINAKLAHIYQTAPALHKAALLQMSTEQAIQFAELDNELARDAFLFDTPAGQEILLRTYNNRGLFASQIDWKGWKPPTASVPKLAEDIHERPTLRSLTLPPAPSEVEETELPSGIVSTGRRTVPPPEAGGKYTLREHLTPRKTLLQPGEMPPLTEHLPVPEPPPFDAPAISPESAAQLDQLRNELGWMPPGQREVYSQMLNQLNARGRQALLKELSAEERQFIFQEMHAPAIKVFLEELDAETRKFVLQRMLARR